MNYDFLMSLPWRLGSLAGLIVGAVSVACGVSDYTIILFRSGLGFFAFYVIGMAASMALRSVAGVYSIRPETKSNKAKAKKAGQENDSSADDQ